MKSTKTKFTIVHLLLTTLGLGMALLYTPAARADVQYAPNHNDSFLDGKYSLLNNEWGLAYNGWGGGSEDVYADTNDANRSWSVDFNWYNVLSDDAYHIKAYPSIIDGWQYGYANSATDLPVQLWDNKHVYSNWSFNYNTSGDFKYDISYDLWLDPGTNPSGTAQDEVMIWLDYSGTEADEGLGDDSYVETVNLDGADWRVHRTTDGRQIVYFVRASKTQSSSIDINDFMSYLEWSKGWIDHSEYLLSVEAGTEIWYGNGTLNTTNYSVNVSQ